MPAETRDAAPGRGWSMTVTRRPRRWAASAVVRPAMPPPSTTRSETLVIGRAAGRRNDVRDDARDDLREGGACAQSHRRRAREPEPARAGMKPPPRRARMD